jgi:glycosyltransferase involved in cell wall biosynthesis
MPKLSIIIPVYNEGENVLPTLRSLYAEVKTDKDIYLVYDKDDDTTLPVIKTHAKEFSNLILLKNKYGRGALNAIKTGLETADGKLILVTMADGSDEYGAVDQMVTKMDEGYAVVVGSRYMRGGKQIGGPFIKKTLSRLAGVSLYYLAGLPTHDLTNSFRMYKKSLIQALTLESKGGFEIGAEITVKAFLMGEKIAEIPTTWRDRAAGKSNFKLLAWLPNYLHWYWLLLLKRYASFFRFAPRS